MPLMRLYPTQNAAIDARNPNLNRHGAAQYALSTGQGVVEDSGIIMGFDYSALYKKHVVTVENVSAYVSAVQSPGTTSLGFKVVMEAWDESTVTSNNLPQVKNLDYWSQPSTLPVGRYTHEGPISTADSKSIIINGVLVWVFNYGNDPRSTTLTTGLAEENIRPYIDVLYTEGIVAGNQSPANIFVDRHAPITFTWVVQNDSVIVGRFVQKAFKFQWREKDSEVVNETVVTDAAGLIERHIVPANTLPKGETQWRVILQDEDGEWANESSVAWRLIQTEETAVSTAVAVSPANTYINSDEPQEFVWQHIIDTGTQPSKSELEYRIGSGVWTLFHTQNGSATTATVPANTLPGGNVQWRVRTFNTDGLAGEWSAPASIVVQGAPPEPGISSVTNDSRPLVSWQSIGQVAYELKIQGADGVVYATGEIAGTDKSHKVTEFFPDGDYTAQLRIRGSTQMWSNWATAAFTLSPAKPPKPTLTAERIRGGIRLMASGAGTLYILRDGVPIAKASETYNDYAALGSHTYVVRAVDGGGYMDSDPVTITAYVDAFTLAAVDDLQNGIELLVRRGEKPRTSADLEFAGTAQFFAGRTFPLYTFSEFTQDNRIVSFTFRNPADWVRLRNLLERRQTLLIRDLRGNRYYGVVPSASVEQDAISSDFTLNITRVDYVERIEYD